VTFDTLRADRIGAYGYPAAETPNLDRMAREGTLFEEARTHVPLTLPSHATVLTGLLPPRHGLRGNGPFRLSGSIPTIASVLRERGYDTAAAVSSVVLDRLTGLDRGFQQYDDNQRIGDRAAFNYLERAASQMVDAATRQISRLSPPFFLWVHLYDPHVPWVAPPSFSARHPGRPYDAEITFADEAFGRIRQQAEARASGHLLTIALSDHGESLGEHGENQHGYTLHRGVLRVPLLVAGPEVPRGRRVRETMAIVDIAPTIAELAGTAMTGIDGKSLVPLLRSTGETAQPGAQPDAAPVWEESLHPLFDSGWAPLRGLLTERWHFVEAPRPELYDRVSDPADRIDLAAQNPDLVRRLREELWAMALALGDRPEPSPGPADSPEMSERMSKLSSLGYLSGGEDRPLSRPRLDPKDGLPGFIAIERAGALLEGGQAGQARKLLEPYLKKDPDNPRLWHQYGMSLAVSGDHEEAERAFVRAVRLDPRAEFIRYAYASLLQDMGKQREARAQLEKVLETNPRAVDAALELASMAARNGDRESSEAILRRSYERGVRDPDLLSRLGVHLLERKRSDEAVRHFAEALVLHPHHPVAALETGRAALRGGDAGRAVELFDRCANGPRAFDCRMERARAILIGSGDLDAARLQLESAREAATSERMSREVELRISEIDRLKRQQRPGSPP
jgi:arylsulfatase A-like enzyme/Tfp pilus assembly protein PilF